MTNPLKSVVQGNCLEVLRTLPDDSMDALITDPPAGIAFMGRSWDKDKGGMLAWVNWLSEVMAEAMRVLKPGACGVVWSIPRTCGWTQLALELSGFRVIDSIAILQGSGFPKAQDIGRMIDRELGCEGDREVVGRQKALGNARGKGAAGHYANALTGVTGYEVVKDGWDITAPASPEAQQWDGWKTAALKPSHESWLLVQKPISEGSIARNVLKWGVGGLNIEAARIGTNEIGRRREQDPARKQDPNWRMTGGSTGSGAASPSGRYPANTILIHSPDCTDAGCVAHCPVAILGEQSGECKSGGQSICERKDNRNTNAYGRSYRRAKAQTHPGDTGTAARYFKQLPHDPDTFRYFPKASKTDRTCNGMVDNVHPTVKSTALMEYFAKLLCPPGGVILDPFGGSGSTALGAIKAGMGYVLIEQEDEYIGIIRQRINATDPSSIENRLQWLETQVQAQGQKLAKLAGQQQLTIFDAMG